MKTLKTVSLTFIITIIIANNFLTAQEWQSASVGYRGNNIEFLNSNTGFVGLTINSGSNYAIYKTTNKGISFSSVWSTPVTTENSNGFGFDMINATTGYLYIKSTLYRTTNGGNNWNLVHEFLLEQSVVQSVKFYDDNLGLIAFTPDPISSSGHLEVWRITNSGQNRSRVYQSSNQRVPVINSIFFSPTNYNNVNLVGYYRDYPQGGYDKLFSLVSTDGGSSFNATQNGQNSTKFGIGMFFSDGSNNYRILGSQLNGIGDPSTGTFCYPDVDAGTRYKITNSTNNMAGLSFINSNTGFAYIGDTLYKTTNSGVNWTANYSLANLSTSNMNSLTAINENIIYVVDQGDVLNYL